MTAPDRVDDIMAQFPLDGPYDPERTVDAARTIAELVRYLNHATPPWKSADCLEFPSQLGSLLGGLSAGVHNLVQLVDQLRQHADRFGQMPALYDDAAGDPQETVAEVEVSLRTAWANLRPAAHALSQAAAAGNRLGIRTDPEGNPQ